MCVHAHIYARCVYFLYIEINIDIHYLSIYIYMYYMYYMHIMCNWMRRLTAVEIWIRLHLRNCTECKLHKKLNGGGNQPHCNAWAKPKRCAYVYIYMCVCSHLFLKTHCTWLGVVYQIDLSCQPRINKQNTRLPNGASGYSLYWRS